MGGFFGGGQDTKTTTTSEVSPAQTNLINLLTPMQVALAQMQTGASGMGTGLMEQYIGRLLGVNYGGPNSPVYANPQNPQDPGGSAGGQGVDIPTESVPGPTGYDPDSGTDRPVGKTNGMAKGDAPTYTGATGKVVTGAGGGAPGGTPQGQNQYPGSPIQYPQLGASTLPQGQLPVQALYQAGPNEMAYPGMVEQMNAPLAQALGQQFGSQGQYGANMQGLSGMYAGMMPGQVNAANQQVGMANQQVGMANEILQGKGAGAGLDPGGLLAAATEQFNADTLPQIQGTALGAGAFGGSGQSALTGTAARNFGLGAGSAIAQQAASLANARSNMGSTAASFANPYLQGGGLLNQGGGLFNQGAQVTGGLGQGALGQQSGLAQVISQLGLSGPGEASKLDTLLRNLGIQGSQAPIALMQALTGAGSGMPSIQAPLPAASTTQTTGQAPSGGAQAGQAVSSILPLIMMLAMA